MAETVTHQVLLVVDITVSKKWYDNEEFLGSHPIMKELASKIESVEGVKYLDYKFDDN